MNEDWISEAIPQYQDFSLTLGNMERIKDLRILLKSTQKILTTLEKNPIGNIDLILQERVILEGAQKEIERLKRKAFHLELG
jgi:hypothetical protein